MKVELNMYCNCITLFKMIFWVFSEQPPDPDAVTSWSSCDPAHHSLDNGLCWFPIAAVLRVMRPNRRKRLIPPSGLMMSLT